MNTFRTVVFSLAFGLGLTAVSATAQQAPVNLRSDSAFAIVAGTTVTVTGAGTITGNIGISPGTAYVAGTPAVTVNGTIYPGGPVAAQAQADLTTAYNDAAGRSLAPITISGNIGGQTLVPGLYKSTSSLAISSGNLTLDAQNNPNAVWIFQIASTLTTTSGRQVILANGANARNIFWQVGSSATLGTTTVFQGNILAAVSITLDTGATLSGRALAIGGAVSIDTGGGTSATVPVAPTGPTVTSTFPANVAVGVSTAGKITATFSTAMNPATITASSFTLTQGAAPISGLVTYAGTTATFAPASALAANTTFTGTVTTAAQDTSGNALVFTYTWTFTTAAAPVLTSPTVISTNPANLATGVPTGTQLSATFSVPMDPATISTSTFTVTQGGTPVSGTVTLVGATATFAPLSNLIAGAAYQAVIRIGAADLAGTPLDASYVWTFTAGSGTSTTPPTVISTTPANGAQGVTIGSNITASFSEAMNPLTISTATFTLQQGATPVAGTVTYAGTVATLTPLNNLASSTTYTATITNGTRDLNGNALAANYVWSFTSGTAVTPPPFLEPGGVVNDASYVAPIVAGSIVGVFGTNLSIGQEASASLPLPLPLTLAQSSISFNGQNVPMYLASPFQSIVQIPWELAGQTQASVFVTVNGVASNTQTVVLVPFAPAIFAVSGTGAGQGAVLLSGTGTLAAPGTAAARGSYVEIFCTGLGAVSNQPATGIAAQANPLSVTVTTPVVTIGGTSAQVTYSGLAPGFAGLYQVNAIVPAGISPGNTVNLVMSMGSTTSNTVTIAVQ